MDVQDILSLLTWCLSFFAIYGSYLLTRGSIHGFTVGLIANAAFCCLNIYHRDYPQAFLFFINFLISVHGVRSWRRGVQRT